VEGKCNHYRQNRKDMKILAIGPYIGDFENELLQFRPYARWLTEAIKWDKIYLSTHVNRYSYMILFQKKISFLFISSFQGMRKTRKGIYIVR
jgi:hypothetical protein